jgi:hypothetical protein
MNPKKNDILERIKHLEEAVAKGREYLETGEHAHWHGFRPLFAHKIRDGKILPPHRDWVKKVFLPSHEKALSKAQKTLENRDKIREQNFSRYGSKLAARES